MLYDWNDIIRRFYGDDAKETPKWVSTAHKDHTELIVSVPGVPRDKLEVYLEGNNLFLEYKDSEETLGVLDTRPFLLKFQGGRGYDYENIDVSLLDGILKIKIPKLEKKKDRKDLKIF